MYFKGTKIFFLACFLLAVFFITACASGSKNTGDNAAGRKAGEKDGKQAAEQKSQEAEWNALKEAAKKEGEVVITSPLMASALDAIRKEWQTQNFGVNLQINSLPPVEMAEKVKLEFSKGTMSYDGIITGINTLLNDFKPKGMLVPIDEKVLIMPELVNPGAWVGKRIPYIDKDKMIIPVVKYVIFNNFINTNMIKPDELKSYRDLLKPEYKGKITLGDPTMLGSGQLFVARMLDSGALDEAYFRSLKDQLGGITGDYRGQLIDWVAQGKYPIGVAPQQDRVLEMIKQGLPLGFAPGLTKEDRFLSSGPNNISLFAKSPHPNAAKLFANWIYSVKTQAALAPVIRGQSVREGVPTTGLPPTILREPGVEYYDVVKEDFQKKLPAYTETARKIFGTSASR